MNKTRLLAPLIILLLGCIWGSSFILIKRGLESFTPIQVAGWRLFLAGIVLLPWVIKYSFLKPYKFHPSSEKIIQINDYKNLFFSGLIGNGIPAFLFSYAGLRIHSGLSGILNAFTPMFTLLLGAWMFKEKATTRGLWGVFIGILGAIAIFAPQFFASELKIDLLGALLVICAAVMYGYNINLIKSKLSHLPAMVKTAYPFVFMGILFGIILFFTHVQNAWDNNSVLAWKSLGYLAILGLLGSAVSMVIFNILIKYTSALVASTNTFIIPIVAVLWGVVEKEAITWNLYLGLTLCLCAVYLIIRKN